MGIKISFCNMPLSYGINKRKMVQKKTPRSSRPIKQVAQDCQKSLEQTNDEIRMYKSHAEKLNEILSAKNLEIAKLSGDNEKLSAQIDKNRRKLDDLYDAEDLLQIERHHNIKLQAELEESQKRLKAMEKTKRLERKKQDRFLEDIERLTLTNDRLKDENRRYILRLQSTEKDVEATRDELEKFNEIINEIENSDEVTLKDSESALTLLNRLKTNREDAVGELEKNLKK